MSQGVLVTASRGSAGGDTLCRSTCFNKDEIKTVMEMGISGILDDGQAQEHEDIVQVSCTPRTNMH